VFATPILNPASQPPGAQASQQLSHMPGVPPFAVQCASSPFSWQWLASRPRQQVTNPGLPQVEWAAHFLTTFRQRAGSEPAATRCREIPTAQAT